MVEAKRLADEKQIRFRENWYSLLLASMGEVGFKRMNKCQSMKKY